MTEPRPQNVEEIERLLATRQELMGWIARLDAAGTRAPESVRTKVRADYRGRLALVVDQLRTHSDAIASSLNVLLTQSREFRQVRGEELEVRAEAELRHAVGEFNDDEWQLVELESSGKIAGFDQELERLGAEINRLEEVQALIAPPASPPVEAAPQPRQRPVAAPHPEPESELMVTHDAELPPMVGLEAEAPAEPPPLALVRDEAAQPAAPAPRPEAPRFVPRAGMPKPPRESGPARAIQFPQAAPSPASGPPQDELAFLRSVTIDATGPGTSTRPASTPTPGGFGAVERDAGAGQSVTKTLKCGECGSMNRPTEWYCERCGAELAAL
jgi:hypothetical protein